MLAYQARKARTPIISPSAAPLFPSPSKLRQIAPLAPLANPYRNGRTVKLVLANRGKNLRGCAISSPAAFAGSGIFVGPYRSDRLRPLTQVRVRATRTEYGHSNAKRYKVLRQSLGHANHCGYALNPGPLFVPTMNAVLTIWRRSP